MDDFDSDVCGKCMYHINLDDTWCCNNEDSEYYGCATEYRDCCKDFEEKRKDYFRNYEWSTTDDHK